MNCSFSDPICTQNVVKSFHIILLTASSLCGRNAQPYLSHSTNQCMYSRPSLQNKSTALSVEPLPLHWLGMQDKLQKQPKNFRALMDSFVVLLPAREDSSISTGLHLIICMQQLSFRQASSNTDRWKREECEWAEVSCHSANWIFRQHFARFISELMFGDGKEKGEGGVENTHHFQAHRSPIEVFPPTHPL